MDYKNFNKDQEPEDLFNEDVEAFIAKLDKDKSQKNIFELIRMLKQSVQEGKLVFVPVVDKEDDENPAADLFSMDKMDIDDLMNPHKEREAIPRKVELFNGGSAYTAFTSRREIDKGQTTKFTCMSMKDFFELAFESDDTLGIVLNPWDISVLLDKQLLGLILFDDVDMDSQSRLYVDYGDVTIMKTDAIVNAANTALMPDEGISKTIFEKAGPGLMEECQQIGGCPLGQAVMTGGYNLPAKYIIHTPAPVFSGSEEDPRLLKDCYWNSLDTAMKNNLHSVSFPTISTGIYGYPPELAAEIAVVACSQWIKAHPEYVMEIILLCNDETTYKAYIDYINSIQSGIE